jgi:hypothetical protein
MVQCLDTEIARRTAGLAAASVQILRINLIESEYLLAMLKAEAAWDTRTGKGDSGKETHLEAQGGVARCSGVKGENEP